MPARRREWAGRVFPAGRAQMALSLGRHRQRRQRPHRADRRRDRRSRTARTRRAIPNEDSQGFEFDETSLFVPNRLPGYDRVDSGQRVDYGLHGELAHPPATAIGRRWSARAIASRAKQRVPAGLGARGPPSRTSSGGSPSRPAADARIPLSLPARTRAISRCAARRSAIAAGPQSLRATRELHRDRAASTAIDRRAAASPPAIRSAPSINAQLTRYWSVAVNDTRSFGSGGATINSGAGAHLPRRLLRRGRLGDPVRHPRRRRAAGRLGAPHAGLQESRRGRRAASFPRAARERCDRSRHRRGRWLCCAPPTAALPGPWSIRRSVMMRLVALRFCFWPAPPRRRRRRPASPPSSTTTSSPTTTSPRGSSWCWPRPTFPTRPRTASASRPQVLRNLIDEKLEMQEAKHLNVAVPTERDRQALANIEKRNNMPKGGLDAYLKAHGIPRSTLVDQITASLAFGKVVQQPRVAGRHGLRRRGQRRDEAPPGRYRQAAEPGRGDFPRGRQSDPGGRGAPLADRLIEQIRGGANFAAVAQQFSQSPSAAVGGDIGWVMPSELSPPLAEAIAQDEPGRDVLSDPHAGRLLYPLSHATAGRSAHRIPPRSCCRSTR